MRLSKIRAFTLIELLVVMSIISMLMAILLPCLRYAREQAKRAVCMVNLRSTGQGIYIYANDNVRYAYSRRLLYVLVRMA